MGQPGKISAGLAQGIVTSLRLDAAQAIASPHGAAPLGDLKIPIPFFVAEQMSPQVLSQGAVHIPVSLCRDRVY
jgi:hypothetical protein